MRFPRASINSKPSSSAGFTLVELMVGMAIGLVAVLLIAMVLISAEERKRTTKAGMDSYVNGQLALATLKRAIGAAGYGIAAVPQSIGCQVSASYSGAPIAGFISTLAPVIIAANLGDGADQIRVIASDKRGLSLPLAVASPGYNPVTASAGFPVASSLGVSGPQSDATGTLIDPGDLMLASNGTGQPCEVFLVNAAPTASNVPRADDGGWDMPSTPTGTFPAGAYLTDLGHLSDKTFTVTSGSLTQNVFRIDQTGLPGFSGVQNLVPGIVNLKAFYGKDTSNPPDGTVDVWDTNTPVAPSDWRQVVAIRVAVVARSSQYEKEIVTTSNPLWNVGSNVSGCPGGLCTVHVDFPSAPDWQHYRYKLFDTLLIMRNAVWNES